MKAVFLTAILIGFLVGVSVSHIYLYRRLFRDTSGSEVLRRRGRRFLWVMAIIMVVTAPTIRLLDLPGERIIGFVAFGWFGFVGVTAAMLICCDLLRLGLRLWPHSAAHDPHRRRILSRGVAGVATVTAGATGAAGVSLAMSDPVLRTLDVPINHLPDGLVGLRIAQLSDIHFGPTLREEFAAHLVERVNALTPDIVVITGDLVDGQVDDLGPSVRRLLDIKSTHGIFFVTGNHEYYSGAVEWVAALHEWGFKVLRNEHATLEHGGAQIDLLGVDDWRASYFHSDHGYDFKRANAGRDRKRVSVLLTHQPKAIHDAARGEIDLVLAGHTHGGQIWPLGHLLKFVHPYVSGLHRHTERTWIYVHSGTGYWGPPVRVGVPSEIALLTLRRPEFGGTQTS